MESSKIESAWVEVIKILYDAEFNDLDYGWGVSPETINNSDKSLSDLLAESQVEHISSEIGRKQGTTEVILMNMANRGLLHKPAPDSLDDVVDDDQYGPTFSSNYSLSEKGFEIAHNLQKWEQEDKRLNQTRYTNIAIALLTFGLLLTKIFDMALAISLSDTELLSYNEPTAVLIFASLSVIMLFVFVGKYDLMAFK